jgi:hypothetical protein
VTFTVANVAASSSFAELPNMFATGVAQAADAPIQYASIARLSGGIEAAVNIPAAVIERLLLRPKTSSGYVET